MLAKKNVSKFDFRSQVKLQTNLCDMLYVSSSTGDEGRDQGPKIFYYVLLGFAMILKRLWSRDETEIKRGDQTERLTLP